jgi:hypothetical protein
MSPRLSPRPCRQCDLFEEKRTQPEIPTAQRSTLVRLIECLLAEAAADSDGKNGIDNGATTEGAHEQDHA